MNSPRSNQIGAIRFHDKSSLERIESDCWTGLQQAVTARECGWRLPVLATQKNGVVRQRTVVLRRVDSNKKTIFIHTDRRSPKTEEIRATPSVSWLFYDHSAMTQIQLTGSACIHTVDSISDSVWNQEPESSLRGYLAPFKPGTPSSEPTANLPKAMIGQIPSSADLAAARENFAVVSCQIETMEWLVLSREGNRRAKFRYVDECLTSEWLNP